MEMLTPGDLEVIAGALMDKHIQLAIIIIIVDRWHAMAVRARYATVHGGLGLIGEQYVTYLAPYRQEKKRHHQ